jgi:hypothetical protein
MSTALANRQPQALATPEAPGNLIQFQPDMIETIRKTVASGIKDPNAFLMFINYAQRMGLDPLRRELYGWTDNTGKLVMITGIDGLRRLGGQRAKVTAIKYFFCGEDAQWTDVWTSRTQPPVACKCEMYLKGSIQPVESIIYYDEFFMPSNPNWKSKPRHMLMLRAEAHCWRKVPGAGLEQLDLLEEGQEPPAPVATITETPRETPPAFASLEAPDEVYDEPLRPTSTPTSGSSSAPPSNPAPARTSSPPQRPPVATGTRTPPGQAEVHPRTRAFNLYTQYGGKTTDQATFAVHVAVATGNTDIEKIQQVTPSEWDEFAAKLDRYKCLPGEEGWPKEAEFVDEAPSLNL